jgi:hypothetical protein
LALQAAGATPQLDALMRTASAELTQTVVKMLAAVSPPIAAAHIRGPVLVSAVEGVVSTVVHTDSKQLSSPQLKDELVRLALSYLRARS